jgi:predicted transcriptional regulator
MAKKKKKKTNTFSDNTGKKYNVRKERGFNVTESKFMAAIASTNGKISRIAEALGVLPSTVRLNLRKPKFAACRKRLEEKREELYDLCEDEIEAAIRQNKDYSTKARTAFRVLESKKAEARGWHKKQTIALEGGDSPIEINTSHRHVEVDKLPLALRKQLLEAMNSENGTGTLPLVDAAEEAVKPKKRLQIKKKAQ